MDERERLEFIVEAFIFCKQRLDREEIAKQYFYETDSRPSRSGLTYAIKHAPKEVAQVKCRVRTRRARTARKI
jgi:hypothetical protein